MKFFLLSCRGSGLRTTISLNLLSLCTRCSSSSNCISRLIPEYLSDCNGAAFVSESKAPELRENVVLFKRHGDASLDATDKAGVGLNKFGHLLFCYISLLVLLERSQELFDLDLVRHRVDVHHALVTLRHNGLVGQKLKEFKLSLEKL